MNVTYKWIIILRDHCNILYYDFIINVFVIGCFMTDYGTYYYMQRVHFIVKYFTLISYLLRCYILMCIDKNDFKFDIIGYALMYTFV